MGKSRRQRNASELYIAHEFIKKISSVHIFNRTIKSPLMKLLSCMLKNK
jgi:hypothetical protein